MTIHELIEKYGNDSSEIEEHLRMFSVELLELVKKKGDNVPEHLCPERHRISIDKALEELRK